MNKHKFAEVFTPPELVKEIMEKIEITNGRIYEPGVGQGAFLEQIINKDFKSYEGCEINPTEEFKTKIVNQDKINIFEGDFFNHELKEYNLIIGNPPFYQDGFKGPPCAKTRKGKTIWPQIVKRCWQHLAPDGILAMVLPCIWLKPDKEKIYDLFTEHQILYLRVYTCVESNKLFKYNAQTPCCYVIVKKTKPPEPNVIKIYDENSSTKSKSRFVSFTLKPGYCIPTQNAELIQSFKPTMKINPIKIAFIKKEIETHSHVVKEPKATNQNDKIYPLITTYKDTIYGYESTQPGKYQGIPKIIMAHKTFPILFMDKEGTYGLYGRDKYVFTGPTIQNIKDQYDYLSQPDVQKIIKSFTIRMNFIEKDIFKYLSL